MAGCFGHFISYCTCAPCALSRDLKSCTCMYLQGSSPIAIAIKNDSSCTSSTWSTQSMTQCLDGPWWTWPGSVPCRPHCRALLRRRRGSRKAWTTRRKLSGRRCCSWNLDTVTLEPWTNNISCWTHHYTIPWKNITLIHTLSFLPSVA